MPTVARPLALVVAAGCLISLITFGVRAGFGLFQAPMTAELGWSRETFALALAIQNLLWGLGQPFAGALADRFGSGRVLAGGALLYAAGVALMAEASSPLMLNLSVGVMVGIGLSGASFSVALSAMVRMTPAAARGWVLGIGTAAGSLGQFLMVPLGQAFLAAYGWHTALLILSLLVLVAVPLSGVLRGAPDRGAGRQQTLREALREAGSHSGYWLLLAGFFVCGFHVAFIQVHMPADLVDRGLAPTLGAWALATVGLFNVFGAYFSGVIGERYRRTGLLTGIYAARALAIAAFLLLPLSPATVLAFSAVMGLLWLSTVPLTSGAVAVIFGQRFLGMLFGIVFFSHQVGAFLGAWLGGVAYDITGSYASVWWLSVALGVFAALVNWPIRVQPVLRAPAADAAP